MKIRSRAIFIKFLMQKIINVLMFFGREEDVEGRESREAMG
jgi:hypothetical protein